MLKDDPRRVSADALAKRVPLSPEDLARVGGRSSVISREAPIPVYRNEGSDKVTDVVAPPPVIARVPTGSRRPEAAELLEKQAGVITVQPQVTGGRAITRTAVAAPARVAPPTVVEPQAAPVVTGSPAAPVPAPVKRVSVVLSSPTIGRHRLKVAQVLISESLVVLAYVDDDDSTIYEPPRSTEGQTIIVEYEGRAYTCVYMDMNVTQPSLAGDHQLLLVVLVRVDE